MISCNKCKYCEVWTKDLEVCKHIMSENPNPYTREIRYKLCYEMRSSVGLCKKEGILFEFRSEKTK